MSHGPGQTAGKQSTWSRTTAIAAFVRDVGVILGLPALLVVGLKVYELETKSLEAQIKANEAQMRAVEAQNTLLKETQYDRALTLIKAQRELYDSERSSLEKQIADLAASGRDQFGEIDNLKRQVAVLDDQKREWGVQYRRLLNPDFQRLLASRMIPKGPTFIERLEMIAKKRPLSATELEWVRSREDASTK